jgi:hypothetical protein
MTSFSITPNSTIVKWKRVTGALSYSVQYKLSTDTGWTNFATAQTDTVANLSGLSGNSTYNWRVRSTCAGGNGDYFTVNFTTLPNCGTPTGLTTTSITGSSANLN